MSRFMPRARLSEPLFDTPPPARPCDHAGCAGTGEFRAPRSRSLTDYYWFCLDHVRSYNASWNYYAGMSDTEIEAEIRRDVVGQRPSWRFGSRIAPRVNYRIYDFGMLDETDAPPKPKTRPPTVQETALATFDLALPLTLQALKTRYKELVKRHHPDANGGDKAAEERLKTINQAYATLKSSYFS
jgi:hypothetical protein